MRRAVLTMSALALAAACGSSITDGITNLPPGGGNPTGYAGNYVLKQVDGKALPAVSGDSTFLSGLIVLTDSTWKQTVVVRYAQGGSGTAAGDSLVEAGGWAISGSKIILFDSGSSENYSGTLTSGGFTLTSKTSTLLTYSK
ncbi:MAG TPA: hypothetical protein VGP25_13060 [Gemmatimonadaceae bacterium]|jgi:hypothetical protein|nr:hypothetical protein [Gemmatimonadaceae bacterium]